MHLPHHYPTTTTTTTRYPAWKKRVIEILKGSILPDGTFPKTAMVIFGKKDELAKFPEAAELKSKGGNVGKFAGQIKQAAEKDGASAFDMTLPFEEVWTLAWPRVLVFSVNGKRCFRLLLTNTLLKMDEPPKID